MKKALAILFSVLFLDQALKFWVKTHLYLGEEIHIAGNWFILHFTENPGMAFGMELGGDWGKLILSVFRIVVALAGAMYLFKLIKDKAHPGLIACGSLILAGAAGNILDSIFYGRIFSDSAEGIAALFPKEGGYTGWLHGNVVDMLYFPILHGHFPSWFPVWGTEDFIFFRPVFNIADSSISIGVFLLFIFQKKFFGDAEDKPSEATVPSNEKDSEGLAA